MKTALRFAAIALLVVLTAWGIHRLSRPQPVDVVLATIAKGRVESTVANTRAGTIRACRRSHLSPATGGQVAQLPAREGDRVRAGQVLMVVWNEDLEARVRLAGSEVATARARIDEVCLQADVAEREARRLQRLHAQNLVSEEQVDRATTDGKARAAACQAAHAVLEVRSAQVEAARAEVERTVLRAPFDGIVAEVNAELGEFVTPSPPGIPTPPAVDLIDDSCMYVAAPIDEVDAPSIRTGMPACVSLDAFPERRCEGRVRRIAPYVLDREKQARTVEVEVEFGDSGEIRNLLPGYSADVEIVLESRDGVTRVPTEAVLEDYRVFVFRESDGHLEERRFEPGLENWEYTEVRSGLAPGEQVVVSVDREGVSAGALARPEPSSADRGEP